MAFKIVNARNVLDGIGFNAGPTTDSPPFPNITQYVNALQYVGSRWIRNGEAGGTLQNTAQGGAAGDMIAFQNAMVSAGFQNPNMKFQVLVYGYIASIQGGVDGRGWSSVQVPDFLNNILKVTDATGHKSMWGMEGPNEINATGGETSHPVDSVATIAQNEAAISSAWHGWNQALATFRTNNPAAMSGVYITSATYDNPPWFNFAGTGGTGALDPNWNIAGLIDFATYHFYIQTIPQDGTITDNDPGTGSPAPISQFPSGSNAASQYVAAGFATSGNPNAPLILSESNAPGWTGGGSANYYPQDGIATARADLTWLCDFMLLGGLRWFLFQLMPDSGNLGGIYGIFNSDFVTPRPTATCFHNFTNIISLKKSYGDAANNNEKNPTTWATFTPAYTGSSLTVTTPNFPSSAGLAAPTNFATSNVVQPGVLIMPKSDGSTIIAVWNEPLTANTRNLVTSITPPADPVTVNFGSVQTYNVFDISGSGGNAIMTPTATSVPYLTGTGSSVTVNLFGIPVLIELTANAITSGPTAPTTTVGTITATSVQLNWTIVSGTSNSPTSYVAQQSTDGTTWVTPSNGTLGIVGTYTFVGIRPATQMFYRVEAINNFGNAASAASSVTTLNTVGTTTPTIRQSRFILANATTMTLSLPSQPTTGDSIFVFFNGFAGSTGSNNSNNIIAPTGSTKISGPNYNTEECTQCWQVPFSTSNMFIFSNFDISPSTYFTILEISNVMSFDTNQGGTTTSTATAIGWPITAPTFPNCVRLSLLSLENNSTIGVPSTGGSIVLPSPTTGSFHQPVLISETSAAVGPMSLAITGGSSTGDAYLNLQIYGFSLPNQVAQPTISNVFTNGFTVSWPVLTNVSAYTVNVTGTAFSQTTIVPAASNQAIITGLKAGTNYSVGVFASNASGQGTISQLAGTTTLAQKTLTLIQSTIGTDQPTGVGSVTTAPFANPTTVGNTLVFYLSMQATSANLLLTPPSGASNIVLPTPDSNTTNAQMMWTQTVLAPATSYAFAGYTGTACLAVVEVQGVTSVQTPTFNNLLAFTEGGTVTLPVTQPVVMPAIGIYGVNMSTGPDSWGTMPAGITKLQNALGVSSTTTIVFHSALLLSVASTNATNNYILPFTLGNGETQQGFTTGTPNPQMAGMNLLGGSVSVPPGVTNLIFGTVSTTSIGLSWLAATGTVTSYQINVSTSANMTSPTLFVVSSGLTTTITPLVQGTAYFFTITAFNGTTPGLVSSVVTDSTSTGSNNLPILIGGKPLLVTAKPVVQSLGAITRNWYENPGNDGSFWVQPFQTTATWTTTGAVITTLRNGSFGTPTGHVHLKGDFSTPWVIGRASDPLVAVTIGAKTIHVRIPAGTITEEPLNTTTDSSIGGADVTQPYLVWSVSGATINTGAITTGSVITGTYGLQVDDGAGPIMTDAITGQPGTNNSIGTIQDFELTAALANPNYVIQHMLAISLDPTQINNVLTWPLGVLDNSFTNTGNVPQGVTLGIPNTITRPTGQTRGFYLLFDNLQQFGWFMYNVSGNGCLSLGCYSTLSANSALATDVANSINAIMPFICILSNQTALSSLKGKSTGGVNAFAAPPLLDLSPTGGVPVLPSTFGAFYPSGYNQN